MGKRPSRILLENSSTFLTIIFIGILLGSDYIFPGYAQESSHVIYNDGLNTFMMNSVTNEIIYQSTSADEVINTCIANTSGLILIKNGVYICK